jgi:hypothetical protein
MFKVTTLANNSNQLFRFPELLSISAIKLNSNFGAVGFYEI